MNRNIVRHFATLLVCCTLPLCSQAEQRVADKLLERFDRLIQGEFDNYNQINFENNDFLVAEDRVGEKHSRMYMRISRIDAPTIGSHVYYQQMHRGDVHSPIYRQVLMVVTADYANQTLTARSYKFIQPEHHENLWERPQQSALALSALKQVGQQCDSKYQLMGDQFVAEVPWTACKVKSKHGGFVYISSRTLVSDTEYWHIEAGHEPDGKMRFGRDDQVPIKMRRATRFQCWAALKTDKLKENGEHEWDFFPNLSVHNQGDVAYFSRSDASDKHYFLRLKETVFPAGARPDVLEIFVHQVQEGAETDYTKALSYTWTNSDARLLGLNLRWFQSSCKRAPQ